MIQLESLTFKNIRSFDTEQKIVLTGRDKLIQIDGKNENTGGSSGAGKTSIFLAMDYLLGINNIPVTILQCRLTKNPIEVSGQFMIDGVPTVITRSKKTGLTIKTAKETISGNIKLAEEKLDELIGIPRKIFRKMIHKKQKEGGFFLNMTAKECYEFLVMVLELTPYINKTDLIANDIAKAKDRLESIVIELQQGEQSLKEIENIRDSKVKPVQTVTKDEVMSLELKLGIINKEIETLEVEKKATLSNNQPDTTAIDNIVSQMKPLQVKKVQIGQIIEKTIKELHNVGFARIQHAEASNKITTLQSEKRHIESAECPTCKQTWTGELAKVKIRDLECDINALVDKTLSYKASMDKESKLKADDNRLRNIYDKIEKEVLGLERNLVEEKSKVAQFDNEITISFQNKIAEKRFVAEQIKLEHTQKINALSSYFDNVQQYGNEIMQYETILKAKRIVLSDLVKEQAEIGHKILVASEAKRLIKAYVLQTFQETLDLIGETASSIIGAIPNMANSTIYFESCKENKDGSLKDEVNAIINIDGTNNIPIKSLSGGEETTINLAVDLAVIDVIEIKAGKGADFFVIDEPFDGLDAVCKENCLEILKQIDTNKKIIMVDHSSELKELVSDVIMVTKVGESSTVI